VGRRFVDMRTIERRMDGKDFYRNRETQRREQEMADRALTVVTPGVPTVTPEELALIRNTIAKDATPEELKLFLYDNARQGVHPLDKLIHFTKRNNKYTPITSIDFMRIRAMDSGECLGNDEATFTGTPGTASFEARVTVYRHVQGQRAPFSATARWSEYKPDHDFMWKKMPHVMLGKCAEALALRKGFPKQLSGLYVKEEMQQAENEPAPLTHSLTASPGPAAGGVPDGGAEAGAAAASANLNDAIPPSWKPFVTRDHIVGVIDQVAPGKRSGAMYVRLKESGEVAGTEHPDHIAQALAFQASGEPVVIVTEPHKKLTNEIISITAAADVPL
jgi:phage recombination protein Bet